MPHNWAHIELFQPWDCAGLMGVRVPGPWRVRSCVNTSPRVMSSAQGLARLSGGQLVFICQQQV